MSDPVTNAEVEDVLASIRRLVGDKTSANSIYVTHAGTDRLLLTPQHRVSERDVFQLTEEHAIRPPEAWQEFEEPPLAEQVTEETGAFQTTTAAQQDERPAPFVLQPEYIRTEAESAPEHVTPNLSRYSNLSEKIAALETAIARTQQQWEPDEAGSDAYAGTAAPAMAWPAQEDLDELGRPLSARDDVVHGADEADSDTQILDEATLKQIIVDIVRQEMSNGIVAEAVKHELQGELGARITRNIRKLVRREIQLALTAQGLE